MHPNHFRKLEKTLSALEYLFVARDFHAIEQITGGIRLSADEIRTAMAEYPNELAGLNWNSLDVVKVESSETNLWAVDIRFKTKSDAKSDLTLSLHVQHRAVEFESYGFEILNIHVL
jgi:hypothetical protein